MKKIIVAVVICFTVSTSFAQGNITPEQYVALYKDIAIREMKRMGVPAAITLAQGILETESGNSALVKKSNNHFGIKCKSTWTAESVTHDDDAAGECFRSYKTAEDSYRDHSNFLRGGERYAFLFKYDVKDYKAWAYGLKKAGYATNPSYPLILIKHIEQYNLQQYTLMGADEVPDFDAAKYQDDKEDKTSATATSNIPGTSGENKAASETLLDVSDKIIMVNGSKCVYAGMGTSLLVVATKNNIPLAKLLGCNELSEDGLLVKSQYVFLEKKSKTGEKDFYVAKGGGESLYDIAQLNGIQMQYMLDYNHLWGNEELKAGTVIYLKPGIAESKKIIAALPQQAAAAKFHTVQAKEGLYSIARKYNITVQQLKEWNNLASEALTIGQQLVVSK